MALLLVLLFLVVPVVEIYVIIQVGQVIGGWQTLGLLVVESLLGGWLVRREGRRAWRALREAFESGRMPGRELADAGLVLVGGTLLLTPGFLTDIVGFFLVLPVTRPIARRLLTRVVARRAARGVRSRWVAVQVPGQPRADGSTGRRVGRGEVVDDQTTQRPEPGQPGRGAG